MGGDGRRGHVLAGLLRRGKRLGEIDVAARQHVCGEHVALEDQAMRGLVAGDLDRLVEQRLVGDGTPGLQAAARRDDELGLAIVNANGELIGGETAEDDGMYRADARCRQHGDRRLRDHRHIDDDPVALADAKLAIDRRHRLHVREQRGIGDLLNPVGDGAVVDESRLLTASRLHVAIETIVAGVGNAIDEPMSIGPAFRLENPLGLLEPVDRLSGIGPEAVRIGFPCGIHFGIAARHLRSSH